MDSIFTLSSARRTAYEAVDSGIGFIHSSSLSIVLSSMASRRRPFFWASVICPLASRWYSNRLMNVGHVSGDLLSNRVNAVAPEFPAMTRHS